MIATIRETIQFFLYARYRWYHDSRWPWGAYGSALIDVVGTAWFTAIALAACFGLSLNWWVFQDSDPRWLMYLKATIFFMVPGCLVLKFFFPKEDLLATGERYDDENVSTGETLIVIYQVFIIVVGLVAGIIRR